jgi:TetR/AcrR family transcriptional repressor of nem operon
MRYPAEHKQQTRERIVKAAARRFRSRGSAGAAIGDLMRDLRLTHGGFYRHFDSKEDLFLAAFEHGLKQSRRRVAEAVARAAPGTELQAIVNTYLNVEHCDDIADGCPVAALASELARRPRVARAPFLRPLKDHIREIARFIPGNEADRTRKAITLFSGMAGTLTIARAMIDDQERRMVLDAAKRFYLDAVGR